jgi:hypothetical protein
MGVPAALVEYVIRYHLVGVVNDEWEAMSRGRQNLDLIQPQSWLSFPVAVR